MMEAASTSETLANFYQTTWHNMPEDSHLHTNRHENLKSHSPKYIPCVTTVQSCLLLFCILLPTTETYGAFIYGGLGDSEIQSIKVL
jgi:Zn-finger protein